MAKQELIQVEGVVIQVQKDAKFFVKLFNGVTILAYAAGKLRQHNITISEGDSVIIEMSPYDTTKGRIMYRNK